MRRKVSWRNILSVRILFNCLSRVGKEGGAEKYPSEEANDAALQRVFDRLKALHEDGYIILASQQVISVPEKFVLSTDELLEESVAQ